MKSEIFVALFIALMTIGAVAAEKARQSVGGEAFTLSYPDGYVDLCSTDADAASDFLSFIPPVNQLLGCYTTPKDYAEWKSNAGGVFSSYLISSVMKQTVDANVTNAEFSAFKEQAKSSVDALYASLGPQIKEQLERTTASISKKYGAELAIAPGQVVPLGIFDDGPNHFSFAWLASTEFMVNGDVTQSKTVQISSTVLSKGKVFVLFTYGDYGEPADIEKYKNVAQGWVSVFEKENL